VSGVVRMSRRARVAGAALALGLGAAAPVTALAQSQLVVGPRGLQIDPKVQARLSDSARVLGAERRAHPDNEGLGLLLADVQLRRGATAAGGALLDTLLHAAHPSPLVIRAAAQYRMYTGRADSAVALLERATKHLPRDGAVWMLLGDARTMNHAPAAAAEAYRRARPWLASPDSADRRLVEAEIAARDTAAAVEALRDIGRGRDSRAMRRWAAERASGLGAVSVADSNYRTLLAHGGHDARTLVGASDAALAAGDTARALTLARRAVRMEATGPEPALVLLHAGAPAPDSARALLRLAATRAVQAHERAQAVAVRVTASLTGPSADLSAVVRTEQLVHWTLDTVAFGTTWGGATIDSLRRAHPDDDLLTSYAGRVALKQGRVSEAPWRARGGTRPPAPPPCVPSTWLPNATTSIACVWRWPSTTGRWAVCWRRCAGCGGACRARARSGSTRWRCCSAWGGWTRRIAWRARCAGRDGHERARESSRRPGRDGGRGLGRSARRAVARRAGGGHARDDDDDDRHEGRLVVVGQ